MRLSNTIGALVGIVLAGIYAGSALTFDVFTVVGIGPGMFPLIVGIAMLLLCLAWLITANLTVDSDKPHPYGTLRELSKPVAILVALVAMLAAIPFFGYIVAGGLMVFLLYVLVEKKRLLPSLIVSVFSSVLFYTVFSTLLGVQLPKGIIGW